jgi:hypothetical protein
MDWSYRLLDDTERFPGAASIFAGGFEGGSAAEVCSTMPYRPTDP